MATIITREVGGTAKNSPLTNAELDNNFINLDDAIENLQAPATTTSAGLMSASDKTKLDGVEAGAQVNTVASVAGKTGAVTLVTADVGGLDTALSTKTDNNVTLIDAAGTSTLPATAAEPVASRLQVLRNNVKQVFADLSNKLNTDFTSLTTRTIDGTETLAFSGGLKATVQAMLNWVRAQANSWTAHQTFNTAGFPAQYDNGNSGTAKTVAFANGQKQKVLLNGNCTFTLTFPGVGNYQLILRQDATGNRTVTWPAGTLYVGGATAPAINTTANGETIVSIYFDGTNRYLAASKVGA